MLKPRDRLLLAFYLYGPCTYAEIAEYLGHLRSRVSIANQYNLHVGYLVGHREVNNRGHRVLRFTVTPEGREYLRTQGHRQVT